MKNIKKQQKKKTISDKNKAAAIEITIKSYNQDL